MKTQISNEGNKVVAKLSGRLDTAASQQFAEDVKPLMEQADKAIVIDFRELDFISSSGLRVLLSLRKETVSKGGNITIKNVNSDIQQVFAITGFQSLFNFE